MSKGADFGIFSSFFPSQWQVQVQCHSLCHLFSCWALSPARSPPRDSLSCSPAQPVLPPCHENACAGSVWHWGIACRGVCPRYFCCFNSWWHFSGFQIPFLPAFPNELKHSWSLFCLWFWEWTHRRPLFCNYIWFLCHSDHEPAPGRTELVAVLGWLPRWEGARMTLTALAPLGPAWLSSPCPAALGTLLCPGCPSAGAGPVGLSRVDWAVPGGLSCPGWIGLS